MQMIQKKIHYWAHTLKGSLAFVKAEYGVKLATQICETAKANKIQGTIFPTTELDEYLKTISVEIDKINT